MAINQIYAATPPRDTVAAIVHRDIWGLEPCKTFGEVFRESGFQSIQLFSLGVEGAELDVLQTMDWTVPVQLWIIEQAKGDLYSGEPRTVKCESCLHNMATTRPIGTSPRLGNTGIVSMEESTEPETTVEIVDGIHYSQGLRQIHFATDSDKTKAELNNPFLKMKLYS